MPSSPTASKPRLSICAAAATGGEITLQGVSASHLGAVIETLRAVGVRLVETDAGLLVTAAGDLQSVHCVAEPYPGFPTDMQAQLTALLTQANGLSIVRDSVFPDRFMHLPELARLGADVQRDQSAAIIRGGRPLQGANVMASDLRASAALVIAGLVAQGQTAIRRIYHLDRGYDALESKLTALGGQVRRVRDDEAVRRSAA
ncbi:MAG: hypothetical protein R3B90_13205 [Planctomycetaceae bacterium]